MVADWAFHNDKTSNGQLHPHAHMMLTMREINKNGFWSKGPEWNDKENLMMWRESLGRNRQ